MKIHKIMSEPILNLMILTFSMASFHAVAQDNNEETLEEVIVYGSYSQSLANSNELKRNADSVIDAISAEDLGKFPDTNVAESLQRITGLSIDRNKGEGRYVTIRGLGPNFVRVTVNGRTAPATGENTPTTESRPTQRAFSFDQVQSEMVSRLEVYKSPLASVTEGGLGGTVNIVTPKPLELDQTIKLSAFGAYEELSDEITPRVSGLFSDKYLDDSLGFLFAASYFDRSIREDNIDVTGYAPVSLDFDGDGTNELTGVDITRNLRTFLQEEERERINVNSTIQWRFNEDMDLTFDFMYTRFDSNELITGAPFRTGVARAAGAINSATLGSNNTVVTFDSTRSGFRSDANQFDVVKESFLFGGNLIWEKDKLTSNIDFSYVENDSADRRKRVAADPAAVTDFPLAFDFSSSFIPETTISVPAILNDPSRFALNFLRDDRFASNDSELQIKGDFELLTEFNMLSNDITSIEFGVNYQDHEREVDFDRIQANAGNFAAGGGSSLVAFANEFPVDNFLTGFDTTFPTSWVTWDIDAAFQHFFMDRRNEIDPARLDPSRIEAAENDFLIEEENIAGYIQANFEGSFGNVPYRGNAGVRVAHTTQTSFGNIVPILRFDQPTETATFGTLTEAVVENSYTEVLPTFNLAFDISDDFVFRMGGGKVLSRPVLQELAPAITSFNPSTGTVVLGNPNLDPFTAWQADLSGEWYFDDDAIFAVGLFWKKVESFINPLTTRQPFINPDGTQATDLAGAPLVIDTVFPQNEDGATISGFEINYTNQFNSLPSPFDGLGTVINYTYVTSDAEFVNPASGDSFDVPGLSKDTFNLVLFYEKGPFSGRVAYNKRNDFLEVVSGFGANPEFVNDFSQVDASASWTFNERFTAVFEAVNLTEEQSSKFSSFPNRLRFINDTGRRFQFGLRASF